MRTPLALWALAAMLASGAAARAATISVQTAAPVIDVEELLEVDLLVTGLGDGGAPSLASYRLALTFDGSLLAGVTVTFGSALDVLGSGSLRGVGIDPGSVTLTEESLDPAQDLDALQPDAFLLATIVLEGTAAGDSDLSVVVSSFLDTAGDPIPVEVMGSTVRVVPEPATAVLLGLGLAAIGGRRR